MPVYPVERMPVTFRGAFPHLSKHDAPIWSRFLDAYADSFEHFAYDVALGGRVPPDDFGSEADRKGWQYSTALKIDVVGFRADAIWIIEVKPSANVSAIGAALAYVEMAELDKIGELPLVPVIVTDEMSADIAYCCEQLGVVHFEFPEPPKQFTRLDEGGAAERKRRESLAG